MKNKAKDIKLFKDLLQYDFGSEFYDFHNDYDCLGIKNEGSNLTLELKEVSSEKIIFLVFENVDIIYFYITSEGISKTLESFYRGRFENNEKLMEVFEDRGCFYLDFSNESKLEFWAEYISIQ